MARKARYQKMEEEQVEIGQGINKEAGGCKANQPSIKKSWSHTKSQSSKG